jgi:hypothetical protein
MAMALPPLRLLLKQLKAVSVRQIMPAALTLPAGVYGKSRTDEEMQLLNEKQFIDLYWLYKHHRSTIHPEDSSEFEKFFRSNKFSSMHAWRLIVTKGPVPHKLKYMGIEFRTEIQLELCCLRTKEVYRHQADSRSRESISALVHQKMQTTLKDGDIDRHFHAYTALRLCQGEIAGAVRLYRHICGDETDRHRIKRLKTKFENWFSSQPGKKGSDPWRLLAPAA